MNKKAPTKILKYLIVIFYDMANLRFLRIFYIIGFLVGYYKSASFMTRKGMPLTYLQNTLPLSQGSGVPLEKKIDHMMNTLKF